MLRGVAPVSVRELVRETALIWIPSAARPCGRASAGRALHSSAMISPPALGMALDDNGVTDEVKSELCTQDAKRQRLDGFGA